jgi:DNA polymerase-3 subunit delta'
MPQPHETETVLGYDVIIERFYEMLCSQRLPHAWLITGPEGIGKATLAYYLSRIVLSFGKKASAPLQENPTISLFGDLPPSSALEDKPEDKSGKNFGIRQEVSRKVSAGSHPDLLIINDNLAKKSGDIPVEALRRVGEFLALTPAESPWRVVLIDGAENMNVNAANALLKVLEEPSDNSLLLLVSHNPAKLLPTLRSRCRMLKLPPLSQDVFQQILKIQAREDTTLEAALEYYHLSQGSPGLAIQMQQAEMRQYFQAVKEIFMRLPKISSTDMKKLYQLADKKGDTEAWRWIVYSIQRVIHLILSVSSGVEARDMSEAQSLNAGASSKSLEAWLEYASYVQQKLHEAERINLDRKLVMADIFSRLAA